MRHKILQRLIDELRKTRNERNFFRAELNNLKDELAGEEDARCYREEQQQRAVQKLQQELRNEEYRRRQEEDARYYKEQETKDLLKKLDNAQAWGDDWGVDRIKRKLKNL